MSSCSLILTRAVLPAELPKSSAAGLAFQFGASHDCFGYSNFCTLPSNFRVKKYVQKPQGFWLIDRTETLIISFPNHERDIPPRVSYLGLTLSTWVL